MRGWVYVISNNAMPDLIKVGYSMSDPELRAKELNHTGTPHPYNVLYDALVDEPRDIEQRVHSQLSSSLEGKEWFRCSLYLAVKTIRAVVGEKILLETLKEDLIPEAMKALPTKSYRDCQKCEHILTGSYCNDCNFDPDKYEMKDNSNEKGPEGRLEPRP